jgi:hypothetical protein
MFMAQVGGSNPFGRAIFEATKRHFVTISNIYNLRFLINYAYSAVFKIVEALL